MGYVLVLDLLQMIGAIQDGWVGISGAKVGLVYQNRHYFFNTRRRVALSMELKFVEKSRLKNHDAHRK